MRITTLELLQLFPSPSCFHPRHLLHQLSSTNHAPNHAPPIVFASPALSWRRRLPPRNHAWGAKVSQPHRQAIAGRSSPQRFLDHDLRCRRITTSESSKATWLILIILGTEDTPCQPCQKSKAQCDPAPPKIRFRSVPRRRQTFDFAPDQTWVQSKKRRTYSRM